MKSKITTDHIVAKDLIGLAYLDICQGAPHLSAADVGAIFLAQALVIFANKHGPTLAAVMAYSTINSYLEGHVASTKAEKKPPKEKA